MLRICAAIALCLCAAACGESGERYAVRLALLLPAEATQLEQPLDAALEAAWAQSAMFAPGGAPGTTIRGEASLARESPDDAWVIRVGIEVPADLRSQFAVPAITAAATAGTGENPPSNDVLMRASHSVVRALEAQCRLARGDAGGLEVLLESGEPLQILVGLRYVVDRQASEHAERVLPLLRSEDVRVRMAALETLGMVGTLDHAAAIVREAHRLDPGATREAYRALARLGGADAVGFLQFAAANEDDPELRAEAERALSSALSGKPASAADGPRGVDLPRIARGHRQ